MWVARREPIALGRHRAQDDRRPVPLWPTPCGPSLTRCTGLRHAVLQVLRHSKMDTRIRCALQQIDYSVSPAPRCLP